MSLRIEEIYKLVELQEYDEACDILYQDMDSMFLDGEFDQCNEMLKLINLDKLDINLLVGLLSITYAAKDKLPYRDNLYNKIQQKFDLLCSDRKEKLLVGLK